MEGSEFSYTAELDYCHEGSKLKRQMEHILKRQIRISLSSFLYMFVLSLILAPCLVNSPYQIILEKKFLESIHSIPQNI